MIYQFGPFELDLATVELRAGGETSTLEPQVFALLSLLIENRDRVVSKDEIIEKVWEGRVVSDAALSSRINRGGARHRRAGITLLGIGFGLMFLIGVAGDEPHAGVGIGGFFAILGLAFFLNSFFESRDEPLPPLPGGPANTPRTPNSVPPS